MAVGAAGESSEETIRLLNRFNDVFLNHDPTALEQLVADDCRIENTQPAPDGSLHIGKRACIELWSSIATSPGLQFEPEHIEARGDLGIIYWKLFFGEETDDWVRGVNIMRIANGQITDAKGYVKSG